MTPEDIERAFAQMHYNDDYRKAPDDRRRVRFRTGWEDATKRGAAYSEATLQRLTWNNLGYRFGRQFGTASPEEIDAVYEHLAILWEHSQLASTEQDGAAAPSAEQYIAAFQALKKVPESQKQMLRLHYNAPARTITATQMARKAGYSHYSIANSQYGRLGRSVGEQLNYNPTKERLGSLVTFEKRQDEWHWIMRPQVAEALEGLGWVEVTAISLPEEITNPTTHLLEGAVCRVMVNAYERNPQARRRCIEAHGTSCVICGFSFGEAYGEVAEGYIHVHHLRPLSEIGGEYTVDPVEDLRPVCPNCHAVLHRRIPAYSIEEVRAFLGGRMVRAITPPPALQPTTGE
ncbi:MAG: HNH endonuclease [Gemmataceae bacterium]